MRFQEIVEDCPDEVGVLAKFEDDMETSVDEGDMEGARKRAKNDRDIGGAGKRAKNDRDIGEAEKRAKNDKDIGGAGKRATDESDMEGAEERPMEKAGGCSSSLGPVRRYVFFSPGNQNGLSICSLGGLLVF